MRPAIPSALLAAGLVLAPAFAVAQAKKGGPSNAQVLERGKYLMTSVVACGNCHTSRGPDGKSLEGKELAGGLPFKEAPFDAYAANITPDPETGVGKWTDAQLKKAIREGIRPDGSVIGPPMPIGFYRGLADADLDAIVAYMRSVPAVKNAVPKSVYRMPLPPNYGPEIKTAVVAPPQSDKVKYGAYLMGPAGHCMDCHTPQNEKHMTDFSKVGTGGFPFKGPWGLSVSRNLTPHETGLKGWSDADIAKAIRTGVRKDGERLKPPMAFDYYANINDSDMSAMIAYMKTLKALPTTPMPVPN